MTPLLRDIAGRLALRNHDELRVIDAILSRLELGAERYGALDLAKPRDWEHEAAEELVDLAIYEACGRLSRGRE